VVLAIGRDTITSGIALALGGLNLMSRPQCKACKDESLMLPLTTVGAAGCVLPTRVAVWIEPVDRGTRLTVVSRQERGVLPRALSEAEFHQAFARQLEETPTVRRGLAMNARFRTRAPTRL
jgi:hypothetical protein